MQTIQENSAFAEFALAESLLNAVKKAGFTQPTPIQEKVIPKVLEGRDVVGQAHTGTGKTAAFALPALQYLQNDSEAQVLVLSPVRELAAQISEEIYRLSGEEGVRITLIHGGKGFNKQIESVRKGTQVVVATPGRLLDLLQSGQIPKFRPTFVVIDEADEMLDQGFLDDIKEIFSHLPKERQTLLFSATMPEPIKQLAKTFLNQPYFVHIEGKERTNENIEQFYCLLEGEEREDALIRFLDTEPVKKAIVFCNTKKAVDELLGVLMQKQYAVAALHGDMEQPQRQKVMGSFRRGAQTILIATEVAARGLNVEDISHVFNYELPFGAESYVHRIGRTGRAGKVGKAISFVTPREFYPFERICKMIQVSVQYLAIPALSEAQEKRHAVLLQRLKETDSDAYAEQVLEQFQQELSLEDIALRLLKNLLQKETVGGPETLGIDIKSFVKKKASKEKEPSYGRKRRSPRHRGPFKRKRRG
jgi:ATP-dependent RNA helicase DeaD